MLGHIKGFGAVLFDGENTKGWASINGAEAFRIESVKELSNEVMWWCNFTTTFINRYGLTYPNLKHTDYIRPNIDQLLRDFGLVNDSIENLTANNAVNVRIVSEIFSRVIRLSIKNYGFNDSIATAYTSALYKHLILSEQIITEDLNAAFSGAYETYKTCTGDLPPDVKVFTVRRIRIDHALDVLSTPVPAGDWEFIEEELLPEIDRVSWLLNSEKPFMANVAISNVDPNIDPILAFGNKKKRTWVSAPEFLTLSKYAEIEVKGIWRAERYTSVPLGNPLRTHGDFGRFSTSLGIVCENYLATMMSNRQTYAYGPTVSPQYSGRTVWLSAADRNIMFETAKFLHNEGFYVREYGKGYIKVGTTKSNLDYFKEVCKQIGLNIGLDKLHEASKEDAFKS